MISSCRSGLLGVGFFGRTALDVQEPDEPGLISGRRSSKPEQGGFQFYWNKIARFGGLSDGCLYVADGRPLKYKYSICLEVVRQQRGMGDYLSRVSNT